MKGIKARITVQRVDNGIVFHWEDCEGFEDPQTLVFTEREMTSSIGEEIWNDINCVMKCNLTKRVEIDITYKASEYDQEH